MTISRSLRRAVSAATLSLSIGALAVACGDDGGGDDTPADPDARPIDADTSPPPAPALGAQLDRMGRPAINTAVNHTFDGDATATQAAKDAWNEDDDPSGWGAAFTAEIAANLAIYDSLDTTCGNQLLAGATAEAGRYDALAGVLADDRLYVNAASGTCTTYLAVEGNAIGISNNDCGGRTPGYDVIDVTYSVVAVGALSGVGDGVATDDGTTSTSAFPFLAAPL